MRQLADYKKINPYKENYEAAAEWKVGLQDSQPLPQKWERKYNRGIWVMNRVGCDSEIG